LKVRIFTNISVFGKAPGIPRNEGAQHTRTTVEKPAFTKT